MARLEKVWTIVSTPLSDTTPDAPPLGTQNGLDCAGQGGADGRVESITGSKSCRTGSRVQAARVGGLVPFRERGSGFWSSRVGKVNQQRRTRRGMDGGCLGLSLPLSANGGG